VSELDAQAHHVWHPWLRVQRLIRSITQERWDREARTVMKVTLKDALKEREKIRRAGWSAVQDGVVGGAVVVGDRIRTHA